jgi:hypothetical protein
MSVAPESGRNRIMIYGPKNDGTYIVEFMTADGETLAISVPRSETAVLKHFQERMPYGLFVSLSSVNADAVFWRMGWSVAGAAGSADCLAGAAGFEPAHFDLQVAVYQARCP